MEKIQAAITGVGGYVPDYVLTNAELETMVDTNDEWIRTRTGIEERRILKGKNKGTSDLAVGAIQNLLEKTNTAPEEIDLLICATTTPDRIVPDTGSTICHKAGLTNAMAFQMNAACSGFIFSLTTATKFIESGSHKKVIVVGADKMSSIIDYQDRTTCIIFGDGGGAVLFEPNTEGLGLQDEYLRSDGVGRHFLRMEAGGSLLPASAETVAKRQHYVYQDGKTVFKYAVSNMADDSATIMERNKLSHDEVQWLVAHQANKRIIVATAKRMGLTDQDKVLMNISRYGNTTSATIPLLLHDFEKKFKKGDNLVFASFGGGFTWGSIFLKWAYDSN